MTDSAVACLVEMSEGRAYSRLIAEAPTNIVESYGLSVQHVASAYVLLADRFCDSLILNRVIGLGVCEPATETLLDTIDAIYLGSDIAAYACEIGPGTEPSDLSSRLRSRGLVPFRKTTMLYRRAERLPSVPCGFRISRVGPERATEFADLTCGIFQFNEPFLSLLRATFQSAAWQHWMAFEGEMPVACAMTYVEGDVAWIGWVGTLPDYRGRGAQSAMTVAQLDAIASSNCGWVTLETATGTRNRPNPSLRNYLRLGWTAAYDRLVYVRKTGKHATAVKG
jgi:hypothetical protein